MAGKKNRSKAAQNSVSAGSKGVNVPTNSIKKDADELLAMTKEQLKIECRKRGQKTSGNKAELVWDRSEWEAGKMEQVVCVCRDTRCRFCPVFLLCRRFSVFVA